MGVCNLKNQKTHSHSLSNNIASSDEKKQTLIQNKMNNPNSNINNKNQRIYGIKKFGVNIKPDKNPDFPLQFIFRMSKVRCKMLLENKLYILQIIFDNKEYPLCFSCGKNPKFIFDESFQKEIEFIKLEESFLEINIYSHSLIDEPHKLTSLTKGEILNESQKYSSLKIDLLTLAIAPEHHDIALFDIKKSHLQKGRISYIINCKHIENIICKIEKFDFNLNTLINTDLCLKLKFLYNNLEKESQYTNFIQGNPIQKENKTVYEFSPNSNDNKLIMNHKLSLNELRNADLSLNIYSGRLVDNSKDDDNKLLQKKTFSLVKKTQTVLNFPKNNLNNLVHSYSLIGTAQLNFYHILNSQENQIVKRSSKFFQSIKNNVIYDEKQNEYKKIKSSDNIFDTENNYYLELFEDIYETFSDNIYYKGNIIGDFNMVISLIKIPLIKQIMFGVMTEAGFEVSSVFLYDNNFSNEKLPEDLLQLIKLKNSLDSYFTNEKQILKSEDIDSIKLLNGIKDCLTKTVEDSVLYYAYSNNLELYKGQAIMIELGINLLEVIDKLTVEQRKVAFEILKLITERSEFDLGTISSKWFKENKTYENNKIIISYEFKDKFLIDNKIIENFIRFNNQATFLCLESITRGKNNDNSSTIFTNYFLSIAYFRVPIYREYFIKAILSNMNSEYKKKEEEIERNSLTYDELIEKDNINSLMLWDNFYKKLNSSINNSKDENAIDIKEMLSDMKDMISYSNEYRRNDWKTRLSKRDFVFFGIVHNLCQYIKNSIDNEINETNENKLHWENIPGFNSIIFAIQYVLIEREVKVYSKSLMNLIPVFIENMDIINNFILLIIKKTNAYETNAVFNFINILDLIFSQKLMQNSTENQFNFYIIQKAFIIIMNTDNSLSISKFIWFYYKHAHLMPMKHLINIVNIIFIPNFYNFFFHWSFQIREIFYYILLYIFEFRLKNRIAKVVNFKKQNVFNLNRVQTQSSDINQIFSTSGTKQTNFGTLFDPYLNVIKGLENIIYTEELEPNFKSQIDEKQFGNILINIPHELRNNIVLSMQHYEEILNNFIKWKDSINFTSDNLDNLNYPELEITPVKDDVVEYSTGYN